jgi:hypothetical protein
MIPSVMLPRILYRCYQDGPVHLAYNPSYSACFLVRIVFFSHKKSANSVFQPAYNSSRTGPQRSLAFFNSLSPHAIICVDFTSQLIKFVI